jgi:hypothetical protein
MAQEAPQVESTVKAQSVQEADPDRVSVWMPHTAGCRGNFVIYSTAAREYDGTGHEKPVLLVREAFVDQRHVSLKEFVTKRHRSASFRRIGVLITAVPHGNTTLVEGPLLRDDGKRMVFDSRLFKSSIILPDGTQYPDLNASLDFFVNEPSCARACKDIITCRVKEWQLIATVTASHPNTSSSALQTILERTTKAGALLEIELPMEVEGGGVETYQLRFSLCCVAGLTSHTALPISRHLPRRSDTCENARGAVALSGGPLFGSHLHDPAAWRAIAHFAARSLFCSMWFETVAVGVHPEKTMAEIQHLCTRGHQNPDSRCVGEHHDRTRQLLRNITMEMEREFTSLRIPRNEWSRVILFPTCRLGSNFQGTEKAMPCGESHHAGQKILGHSGYAMFGPYHAWVSNPDVDEFIVDEGFKLAANNSQPRNAQLARGIPRRLSSAAERFDAVRKKMGKSSLRMPWFDFRMEPRLWRNLTSDVMRGMAVHTRGFGSQAGPTFNRTECYMATGFGRASDWGGGKVSQHCSDGFGFMVHDAFNLAGVMHSLDLSRPNCVARTQRGHPPPFYVSLSRTAPAIWQVRLCCQYIARASIGLARLNLGRCDRNNLCMRRVVRLQTLAIVGLQFVNSLVE